MKIWHCINHKHVIEKDRYTLIEQPPYKHSNKTVSNMHISTSITLLLGKNLYSVIFF